MIVCFRLICLFVLAAVCHVAFGQLLVPDSLIATGKTVQNNREGQWMFYSPSDRQLQVEGSYRRGQPEGKWFWYANRRVFHEQHYRRGVATGWGKWYADGKIVYEQWFRGGQPDSAFAYYNSAGHYVLRGMTDQKRPRGMWQLYFPDGKLAAEWHWFRQGAYHGASQWFYPNGKIFAKGDFLTKLAEGRWEFRAPDESWQIKGNFKDGVPHGNWEISEAGKRVSSLLLKDGKLEGQQLRYDASGQVSERMIYATDQLLRLEAGNQVMIDTGTGERIFKDIHGNIVAKGSYQNGFLEGNVQYFSALQEVLTQNYRKGQADGAFELRTIQDELLMRGYYRNGQIDSLCVFFYPNGVLQAQGQVVEGIPQGEWQFFYANQHLQAAGQYHKGIAEGKWTYYDEQGQITATGIMQGGCPTGEWLFYKDKQTVAKGYFEDGLRHGMWTDYQANGSVRATGSYAHDCEQGEWRYFHSKGQERQREEWQAGRLLSISDFVAANGRKLPAGNFKNGNGNRLIYHEKRRFLGKWQVSMIGNYKDGLPEGRWRYYDRKGRLQKERIFVHGKPKSDD
ncbi:toxin-antitoxin system YwqK family antitoxin [Rhodoflexus sp.]